MLCIKCIVINYGMHHFHSKIRGTDVNLLITLSALLETGSVSTAAERIGRSQSAVSHALNRLRHDFDDPLLLRRGRAMRLTPFAQDLRPDLAVFIAQLAKVIDRKSTFDPATSVRPIRVACRDIAMPLLSPILSALAKEAPRMPVQFVDAVSAVDAVRIGDADIGLAFRSPKSTHGLAVTELGPMTWAAFGDRNHPFMQSGKLEDWLVARHIVVGSDAKDEGPVDHVLKHQNLNRRVAMRVPSFTTALAQLQEMDAIFTTLFQPFARLAERLGLSAVDVPLDLPSPSVRIVVSSHDDPAYTFLREIITGCSWPACNKF